MLGAAAVKGLNANLWRIRWPLLACAKHFVGDGGTVYGTGEARFNQGDRDR